MGQTAEVLAGVHSVILGMREAGSLPGLNDVQTKKQWVPRVLPEVDKLPLCMVAPAIEPPQAPVRNLSKWSRFFSVYVVFTSSAKQVRQSDTPKPLDWMDTVFEHFLKSGNLLPTVPAVDLITVIPGATLDLAAYDAADLWWSALTLNCRYRGAT